MLTRPKNSNDHLMSATDALRTEGVDLAAVLRFVARKWLVIALGAVAGAVLAFLLTGFMTPQFTAQTQLLIETSTPQVSIGQLPEGLLSLDTPKVESQLALLRSERIAETVVTKLGLLDDPELVQKPSSPGTETRSASEIGRDNLLAATAGVQERMTAERVGLAYAIDISYVSGTAANAARMANAIADAYVDDQLQTRAQSARQGSLWLEERINEIRLQMNAAAIAVQEFKARRDYRIVGRPEDGSNEQASGVDAATKIKRGDQTTLEELESRSQTSRKIFESYLQAYAESVQRQSYPAANARVISRATEPKRKSSPQTMRLMIAGFVVGGLLSLGGVLASYGLGSRISSERQIVDGLGLACLGTTPPHGEPLLRSVRRSIRGLLGRRAEPWRARDLLESRDAPYSRFSQSLRAILETAQIAKGGPDLRSIGLTSLGLTRDTSVIAYNLATLGRAGDRKVLFIDANTSHPAVSNDLAPGSAEGLLQVVFEKAAWRTLVIPGTSGGADILPLGRATQLAPAPAWTKPARELLVELAEDYELVVVDLPPVRSGRHLMSLGGLLDAVAIVAEREMTPVGALRDAVDQLRYANVPVLGVIVDHVDSRDHSWAA